MDAHTRLLQRYVDGELGADEAAAARHLIAGNAAARDEIGRLEHLHARLERLAQLEAVAVDANHEAVSAICRRLPATAPQRQRRLPAYQLLTAVAAVAVIGLAYGLAGHRRDLLPLSVMAVISLVIGLILIVMAGPLLRGDGGALARLLRRPVTVGTADVWTCRAIGLAIVIGGIYLVAS